MKEKSVSDTGGRKPDPMDIHVGSRVRLRRMTIGMTQEKLAEKMELTFQQIQKYEKATNRISASRLFELSQILDVSVQFFFDHGPTSTIIPTVSDDDIVSRSILDFLATHEGQDLNRAFAKIRDPKIRKRMMELVRAITKESPK